MATLTSQQLGVIKADILATPELNDHPNNSDGNFAVAALYNTIVTVPASFWVWRTNVTRAEIYTKQNDLAVAGQQTGFWRWDTFKAQNITEQNAWVQMFMGDQADFSKFNLRDGVAVIFTGSAAALAQQAHILAIARRPSTRIEKLLATGTGTTASPASMNFEGNITGSQVEQARNS